MAEVTSGSFDTPTVYYTNAQNKKGLRFSWSIVSQDEETNKTTISYTVKGIGQNASNGVWVWMYDCKVKIQGRDVYSTSSFGELRLNQVVSSGQLTLDNNDDGTLTLSASITSHIGYTSQSSNGSGTWDLPTIARPFLFKMYTASGWVTARPYMYQNGNWKEIQNIYVRENNSWKENTNA